MADINWTAEQRTAIESRGKTLLVSAAAGSGKTAVLTARIISRITDPTNPLDISRVAVVTFTKAAAAELKERISLALTEALKRDPRNSQLTRQLIKLDHAKISTIHSFCYDMIRSNFNALGLSGEIRVADSGEMQLIRKNIMSGIIDVFYAEEKGSGVIADFPSFAENFISDRDDRLVELFITFYEKLSNNPRGINMLDDKIAALENTFSLENDLFDNIWGNVISKTIKTQFEYYHIVFTEACKHMGGNEKLTKNYLPSFEYSRNFVTQLISALDNVGYFSVRELLADYLSPRLGSGVKKSEQDSDTAFYKDVRTSFNKHIKKLHSEYFSISAEQAHKAACETAALCRDVSALLIEYEKALNTEKRRRGIVDFGDLERLSYKLLYDQNKPSAYAETIRQYYDEIYIDEYQDTNELQDLIFRAISRPNNRFMVGDIKQSIYGFRGALPSLFSSYRDSFPLLNSQDNENNSSECGTIFLSDNFRCDRPIIEVTNAIFGRLFTNNSGRVPYYPQDALIFSKNTDEEMVPVNIVVVGDVNDEQEDEVINNSSDASTASKVNNDERSSNASVEARYVASEISRLLSQGYKPGDIAILFRSAKNSSPAFEEELAKINVPFFNNITRDFFENAEILLVMCLLNCIDNPSRDIYLAGALKSPIFGFTLDELAEIRLYKQEDSFYEALKTYTENNSFKKGEFFLKWLAEYREFARAQTVDKLIWWIYLNLGLISFATEGTAKRNLMLLYDYARKFEAGSFKGLYNFIIYINGIIEEGATFDNAKVFSESEDTIKIMTVHQSKGLEFPVCFLCDSSRRLNRSDASETILYEDSLGIAMRLRDDSGFVRRNTPIRQALSMRIIENSLDEEMRVLYVALTRARERLYVTAKASDPQKLYDECRDNSRFLSPYVFSRNPNYMAWILTALFSQEDNDSYTLNTYYSDSPELDLPNDPRFIWDAPADKCKQAPPPELSVLSTDEYRKMLIERFYFKYPWEKLSKHPAKLTVSRLYPGVLDDEEDVGITKADFNISDVDIENRMPQVRTKPRFLEASKETATAADRGIATHVFMQFCNFALVENSSVSEEIERLKALRFITPAMASLVNVRNVEHFFSSGLYKDIKTSREVRREVRFNVNYPAELFTTDEESKKLLSGEFVLVQGVIDCYFELDDGTICLIDYKTDYVPPEIRGNKQAEDSLFIERHSQQLLYYRYACEKITAKRVSKVVIYSFSLRRGIIVSKI